MKFVKLTGAAAVLLCLGTMMPVYAQRDGEKQGEKQATPPHQQQQQRAEQPRQQQQPQQQRVEQPRQQQQPQEQRVEQPRQQQQPRQRVEQPRQHQQPQQQRVEQPRQQQQPRQQRAQSQQPRQRSQEQARSWQQQKGWVQQGGWQGHATFQQNRSQNWSSDHRTWAQRGGYGGYYIPQDRFTIYFGSQHVFRLGRLPIMYMGYPRFSYGGFSFLLVDPWPANWHDDWYATDDVYVDYDGYDNGYYLYNGRYPDVRLAITVVM